MSYTATILGMGVVSLIFVFLSMNVSIPEYDLEEMKRDKKKFWDAFLSSGLKILFNSGAILMLILILNAVSLIAQQENYDTFKLNVPLDSAYLVAVMIFVVYFTLKVVSLIYDTYTVLSSGVNEG